MACLDQQTYRNVALHLLRYITPAVALLLIVCCAAAMGRHKRLRSTACLLLLTLLQMLIGLQFLLRGKDVLVLFGVLVLLEWALFCACLLVRVWDFRLEALAFFLSTLCLAVVCTVRPSQSYKQLAAIGIGAALYFLLLRGRGYAQKLRPVFAVLGILLPVLTLLFGKELYGAKNWIVLGPFSIQPSELVKLCYILVGAEREDRLRGKSLIFFIAYTLLLCGLLALMNDLGTALIFFCTGLVIMYLRAGSMGAASLALTGFGAAAPFGLQIAPHALRRLLSWGHIWQDPLGAGYQQTQALIAIASGGLFGHGAGAGRLKGVFAADSDMVFAALAEEWGLMMALLAVAVIVGMVLYALRSAPGSSFSVITACAAAAILLLQTMLNVLGTVDLLPFTGVTFPFLSNGGSSMVGAWCLLALIEKEEEAYV